MVLEHVAHIMEGRENYRIWKKANEQNQRTSEFVYSVTPLFNSSFIHRKAGRQAGSVSGQEIIILSTSISSSSSDFYFVFLKMVEDHYNPSEINSVDFKNVLEASTVYMNKKRKLEADQLGLPLSKHNSWDRGVASEFGSPSNEIPEREDFCIVLSKGKIHGEEGDDESELDSGNGSNSIAGDADSNMSVYGEYKNDLLWKTFSGDDPSTPSVTWGGDFHKSSLYSLDSRSVTKSSAAKDKSPFKDGERYSPPHDIGLLAPLNYEQLLEYESNVHYACSDYEDDSIGEDNDLQDLLYTSSGNANNFVLSSGRWDVNNQETQPATEKLTIDKEFELYFSTLML